MKHRLFTCFAAGSLVLGVLLAGLWVRSYVAADRVHARLGGRRSLIVAVKQGHVVVVGFMWHGSRNGWRWDVRSYSLDDELSFPVGPVRQYTAALGFGVIRRPLYMVMRSTRQTPRGPVMMFGAATATLRGWGVIVPLWFLVVLTAVPPGTWLLGRRRRRRAKARNLCPECGYDLRASTQRCPECGAAIEAQQ